VTAILVDAGVVTDAQVEAGLVRQRETGRKIGECLVDLGIVSEEDIAWALARQLGLSFVDVQSDTLDVELVRSQSESVLRRLQVVPIVRSEDRLVVAAVDPTDQDGLRELEKLVGTQVDCVSATAGAIERALDDVFGPRQGRRAPTAAAAPEPGRNYDILWERSGETFLQFHLTQSQRAGASEVHFVQAGGTLHVLHRIGTQLTLAQQEPADVMEVLIHRLEALGMPASREHEGHHTWSGAIELDGRERPIFASRLVARGRISVTVRLLRDPNERARLEHLGLEPLDLARLRGLSTEPSGLVLVCGPTGSGCSTTLAALLAELPTEDRRWIVFARDQRRWPAVTGLVEVITGPTVRKWRSIAVAHGADGLVLDGGLAGSNVHGVLASATHARWVLARTDWEDSFALIEWLTSMPNGRSLLSRRLKAVIQQRLVVATPSPGEPGAHRVVHEVLFATDPLLAAIQDGADVARLRKIAAKDGFKPLEALIRAGVDAGTLDPQDARRALA
jgi:Tfp pilus assembly pilus retraction ATPase PilT